MTCWCAWSQETWSPSGEASCKLAARLLGCSCMRCATPARASTPGERHKQTNRRATTLPDPTQVGKDGGAGHQAPLHGALLWRLWQRLLQVGRRVCVWARPAAESAEAQLERGNRLRMVYGLGGGCESGPSPNHFFSGPALKVWVPQHTLTPSLLPAAAATRSRAGRTARSWCGLPPSAQRSTSRVRHRGRGGKPGGTQPTPGAGKCVGTFIFGKARIGCCMDAWRAGGASWVE